MWSAQFGHKEDLSHKQSAYSVLSTFDAEAAFKFESTFFQVWRRLLFHLEGLSGLTLLVSKACSVEVHVSQYLCCVV